MADQSSNELVEGAKCVVCHERMSWQILLVSSCGHMMCSSCEAQYRRANDGESKCPFNCNSGKRDNRAKVKWIRSFPSLD